MLLFRLATMRSELDSSTYFFKVIVLVSAILAIPGLGIFFSSFLPLCLGMGRPFCSNILGVWIFLLYASELFLGFALCCTLRRRGSDIFERTRQIGHSMRRGNRAD